MRRTENERAKMKGTDGDACQVAREMRLAYGRNEAAGGKRMRDVEI